MDFFSSDAVRFADVIRADFVNPNNVGTSIAAITAKIAIVTISSTKVKPRFLRIFPFFCIYFLRYKFIKLIITYLLEKINRYMPQFRILTVMPLVLFVIFVL